MKNISEELPNHSKKLEIQTQAQPISGQSYIYSTFTVIYFHVIKRYAKILIIIFM